MAFTMQINGWIGKALISCITISIAIEDKSFTFRVDIFVLGLTAVQSQSRWRISSTDLSDRTESSCDRMTSCD